MKKQEKSNRFNWVKYTKIYLLISALFIGSGILSITQFGIPLGLDFTGGAIIDYKVDDESKVEEIKNKFEQRAIEIEQTQTSEGRVSIKTKSLDSDKQKETENIATELNIERLQLQNVGPTVGPELVKKTIYAILIAATAILLWVASQFKKLTFGIAAILAMLHDTAILIGMFSIFGKAFDAEVDFLFVTAVLTTLSFSVHDTIVVFDRIREIQRKHGGEIDLVANRAITETMRRSIINSLTIIIMLVCLVVLGGESIRWFALALLVGAVSGTYSSPFIAVPLYVSFEKMRKKLRKK